MYHFVWLPKVFTEPYRTILKSIIEKIGYDYSIDIVELEIPADHILMIISSDPKVALSDILQKIKSISARHFFRIYPDMKKNNFREESYGHKVIL